MSPLVAKVTTSSHIIVVSAFCANPSPLSLGLPLSTGVLIPAPVHLTYYTPALFVTVLATRMCPTVSSDPLRDAMIFFRSLISCCTPSTHLANVDLDLDRLSKTSVFLDESFRLA